MASINKIEFQNLQQTENDEGSMYISGIVSYNGQILGRWTMNGDIDNTEYEFDKDILREEVKKVALAEYNSTGIMRYFDVDLLLLKLAVLTRKEDEYKKGLSLGYKTFVCADDFENCLWYCDKVPLEEIKSSEEYKQFLRQVKEELNPNFRERLLLISDDLSDFCITV